MGTLHISDADLTRELLDPAHRVTWGARADTRRQIAYDLGIRNRRSVPPLRRALTAAGQVDPDRDGEGDAQGGDESKETGSDPDGGLARLVQLLQSQAKAPAPEVLPAAQEARPSTREAKVIVTALCGHGLLDLAAYQDFLSGTMVDSGLSDSDLAAALAEEHDLSKKAAEAILTDMVGKIAKHLKKGERVRIVGLGILQVRKRAARMGRNPATGEAIQIKASKKVAFRAAKELKEAV